MKPAIGVLMIGVAGGLLLLAAGTVRAIGPSGPTIALGTASGNSVPVSVTSSPNGWQGFNVHIVTRISNGAALNSISASQGSALVGQAFCPIASPYSSESIFACAGLEAQSITAAGTLATFTIDAAGNGCIDVNLALTSSSTTNTYTVDAASAVPQSNVVSSTGSKVLVGSGTANDCDSDADGYTDGAEITLTENPNAYCAIMRGDLDGNGTVNGIDLATFAAQFLKSVPPAPARVDQINVQDHVVNGLDLAALAAVFLKNVSTCP